MSDQAANSENAPPRGRLLVGAAVLVFGWLCPLFVPLVLATDLDAEWKTVFSGLLLLGIPELFTLAAMAVLGKAGFHYLREILYRLLGRLAPPDAVGPTRYRIGLVIFYDQILPGSRRSGLHTAITGPSPCLLPRKAGTYASLFATRNVFPRDAMFEAVLL